MLKFQAQAHPQIVIPIAQPWLGNAELEAVKRPILSGWVTQGPEVAAFEQEFADYVGADHACAVSNCTNALHLALLALGVQAGDEVITVSHSYIATANSIRYCGATPVFVDIDPQTFNLNPALIEAAISPRTKAILVVHQMGMPCDLAAILAIARHYGLPVVEDAACAIGSEIEWEGQWEKIGKPHGDIACFSFHPRKVITTGDGGMLTTSNGDWDQQFRLWRQHGMGVTDTVRHGSKRVIFESYDQLGYNYRMTDVQAAIGREQLKRLPQILARRRDLARRYHHHLQEIPELGLPLESSWAKSNWQSYAVRLPQDWDQHLVMQVMLDFGISTRRGIMCAHREKAYQPASWRCRNGQKNCDCPVQSCQQLLASEIAQEKTILLPLFYQMEEEDQDYVISILKTISQFLRLNHPLTDTVTDSSLSQELAQCFG